MLRPAQPPHFARTWQVLLCLAGAWQATACGEDPTAPTAPLVSAIEVQPAAAMMVEGERLGLQVVTFGLDGVPVTDIPIRFYAEDEQVASVDGAGVVTAKRAGTTPIAVASGGAVARVEITVQPRPVANVRIQAPRRTHVGWTEEFWVEANDASGNPVWGITPTVRSGDERLARIDWHQGGFGDYYTLTALGPGEVTIFAQAGAAYDSTTVSIAPAVIEVTPREANVTVGRTVKLTALATAKPGQQLDQSILARYGVLLAIEWTSDDPGIATVDRHGAVTAIAPGTVTIRAGVSGPTGTYFAPYASSAITVDAADPSAISADSLIYELTAYVDSFDPAWGDQTGARYTAILALPVDFRSRATFGGSLSLWRYEAWDAQYELGAGVVVGTVDPSGSFQLEARRVEEQFSFSMLGSALDESRIVGTWGCCGHMAGHFQASLIAAR